MARTWVLHTETKGTGAQMVPLETVTKRSSAAEPVFVPQKPSPVEPDKPKAPQQRKFKVVDVMTRQVLADDVNARETIDELRGVRSTVDVNVYVWEDGRDRWRLLSLADQRAMWELARR